MGVQGEGVLVKMDTSKPKLTGGRPSRVSLQNAQRDLTAKQVQYVVWAATPEKYRQPSSRRELADVIGVTEVTMWRWSKNPKVINAIRWMVLHHAGDPENVSTIIGFLQETAMDPEVALKFRIEAAKEFLAAVGVKQTWKNPTPELLTVKDVDEIDLESLSDDELFEMYEQLAKDAGLGELNGPDDSENRQDAGLGELGSGGSGGDDVVVGEIVE